MAKDSTAMTDIELAARWLSLEMDYEGSKDRKGRDFIKREMKRIYKCLRNRNTAPIPPGLLKYMGDFSKNGEYDRRRTKGEVEK